MNSLKTKTAVFPFIIIASFILNFYCCPKLFSQPFKVFSMKIDASDFIHLKQYDLIAFAFRKEYVTLFGSKYVADAKAFPSTSTKKIELKKDSHVPINGAFRALVLSKDSIDTFISRLNTVPDNIDLNTEAANYEIVFIATLEHDSDGSYIGFTVRARKKNDAAQTLSASRTKINPCPPCKY
jgi:hypothetical protein